MADLNLIAPSASDPLSSSYWGSQLMNVKPISATAQNGASSGSSNANPLGNFGASVNTEANNSVAGNLVAPSAALPATPAAQQAANTSSLSSVGNTQAEFNAATTQMSNNVGQMASQTGATGSSGGSSTGGLPSSVFQQAVSGLKNYASDAFNNATQAVNNFGNSVFGTATTGSGSTAISSLNGAALNSSGIDALGTSSNIGTLSSDFGANASTDVGSGLSGDFGSGIAQAGATDALGGSLTLSGALGAAGLGYAGGSLLAGLVGEKSTGGGIGGAGGAVAGAEIGSIFPGIGTIAGGVIGGVAGSLLGGLFGAGKGTTADAFGGALQGDGTVQNPAYTAKNDNMAFAQQAQTTFSSTLSSAAKALGFGFTSDVGYVSGGYNSLHSGNKSQPGWLNVGGQQITYDPNNSQSTTDAYFTALSKAASLSGYTNTTALHNWFYGTGQAGAGIDINPQDIMV